MRSTSSGSKMPAEEAVLMGLLLARKTEMGEVAIPWFFRGLEKLARDFPGQFRGIYDDYRRNGLPADGLLKDFMEHLGFAEASSNFRHRVRFYRKAKTSKKELLIAIGATILACILLSAFGIF